MQIFHTASQMFSSTFTQLQATYNGLELSNNAKESGIPNDNQNVVFGNVASLEYKFTMSR